MLASFLHAETEDEFAGRVKAARESKDVEQCLALYQKPESIDPQITRLERSYLEDEFKTFKLKSVTIVGFIPGYQNPAIGKGKIFQLPAGVNKCIYIQKEALDGRGFNASMIPIIQDKEGKFWFASPKQKTFEWNGPELDQFTIKMKYAGNSEPCPEVLVLIETCGYTNWTTIRETGGGFSAHKVLQLIAPPSIDGESISFEISKNNTDPFFSKTVNTSKGAVIQVDGESGTK